MCYIAITLNLFYYCVVCVYFSKLWGLLGVVKCADLSNCVDLSGGAFLRQVRNRTIICIVYAIFFLLSPFIKKKGERKK